jgi:hypothetical protein
MFPAAIKNADTILKATDAIDALVLAALHGNARAAAREAKVSERVKAILGGMNDAPVVIRSSVTAGELQDQSPANWTGGSEGIGPYRTGTAAILQLISSGGFFGPAVADMVQGPLRAEFKSWTGTFVGKEGSEGAPNGTRSATDKVFVDALVALDGSPITSSGGQAADAYVDCASAMAALDIGATAKMHWCASPDTVKRLVCMGGALGYMFPGDVPNLTEEQIAKKVAEGAILIWDQATFETVQDIAHDLHEQGASDQQIDAEIRAFLTAVRRSLHSCT